MFAARAFQMPAAPHLVVFPVRVAHVSAYRAACHASSTRAPLPPVVIATHLHLQLRLAIALVGRPLPYLCLDPEQLRLTVNPHLFASAV